MSSRSFPRKCETWKPLADAAAADSCCPYSPRSITLIDAKLRESNRQSNGQRAHTTHADPRINAGNKLRSFIQSYELAQGKWRQSSPFPLELNGAVAFKPSPSGRLLAIVREDSVASKDAAAAAKDAGYVIEIWNHDEGRLVDQIPTAGVHGKIAGGNWFGGLSWSPDESKVVYVAQKKAAETRLGGGCVRCVCSVGRSEA